ncbi:MAG: chorismate mutase [Candidatus Peribacteraceae bacterium]|nr:chorismate mutase [Candidatus Peribacteraceae bacterium]
MSPSQRLQLIDRQILDLLAERLELAESAEEEEKDDVDGDTDEGTDLEWWIEEGAERGIDDVTVEKVFKAINAVQSEE